MRPSAKKYGDKVSVTVACFIASSFACDEVRLRRGASSASWAQIQTLHFLAAGLSNLLSLFTSVASSVNGLLGRLGKLIYMRQLVLSEHSIGVNYYYYLTL